ncbi:winged helix-turn-helix transcriptional regulator [Desmospora activa]
MILGSLFTCRIFYISCNSHVEYQMTEKGKGAKPIIRQIHGWASNWLD